MTPELDLFISHSLLALISRMGGGEAFSSACIVLARRLHNELRADDFVRWMDSSPSDRLAILAVPAPDKGRDPGFCDELEHYKKVCHVIEARIACEDALLSVRELLVSATIQPTAAKAAPLAMGHFPVDENGEAR